MSGNEIDTSGFDKQIRKAKALPDKEQVPLNELFDRRFMIRYTDFTAIDEFFSASPIAEKMPTDIDKLPEEDAKKFNQFVSERTRFSNWEEMMTKAVKERIRIRAQNNLNL
jgi:hypothetical protein